MATTEANSTSFFFNPQARGFGAYSAADDRMHREMNALVDDPTLVETQYLGFNVPSAGVHAFNYLWAHPNLDTASGGVWAWQGVKPTHLHSEIFDMQAFLPISTIGDYDAYTLPNGYHVEVVKPLEEIRIGYEDPVRNNAFDVTLTAVMPPAMVDTGRHFEQAMRTRGSVRMRGTDHTVDGFTIRDRSWGETRPENPRQAPALHFVCPVFDEDFAIHAFAPEDPEQSPLYEGLLDLSPEQASAFGRGWVWRGGELTALASIRLACTWDLTTRYPSSYQVSIVDVDGRPYTLTGTLIAASNWYIWSNMYSPVCLFRWECDGKVGYGDAQVGVWTDLVRERLP
jgi:hypothetical protein